MKAKIDLHGDLHVRRPGYWTVQHCPYNGGEQGAPCGDWCPKFEEENKLEEILVDPLNPLSGVKQVQALYVTVCGGPTYEIIADERPKEIPHAAE